MKLNIPGCSYPQMSLGWILSFFKFSKSHPNRSNLPADMNFALKLITIDHTEGEMRVKDLILQFHPHLDYITFYIDREVLRHLYIIGPKDRRRLMNYIGLNGPTFNLALRKTYPPSSSEPLLTHPIDGLVISGYDFNGDKGVLSLSSKLEKRKEKFNNVIKILRQRYPIRNISLYLNALMLAYLYDLYQGDIVQESRRSKLIFEQLNELGDTKVYTNIFHMMEQGTYKYDMHHWITDSGRLTLPIAPSMCPLNGLNYVPPEILL